MIRKAIKLVMWVILFIVVAFTTFLGYQTLTEFKPPKETVLETQNQVDTLADTLTLISWNIGYFGLGADMDFFYEGGTMVRPTEDQYERYSKAVLERIKTFNYADFLLLQEVDTLSHRSYRNNQLTQIQQELPGFDGYFGANYNAWVPIPPSSPMGKVKAGQVTMSKYKPVSAKRVAFESSYSWPMRLFQLKRCYVETRYLTSDGKELVLINTHNSAFDDAAALREKELNTLKQLMHAEYLKGNYVVIGGDWNQNPPAFDSTVVLPVYKTRHIRPGIPYDFLEEDWLVAYDPLHTTNRNVNTAYKEGETISNLIDFFVLSPNVKLESIQTIPTGYKESDHQPVVMKIVI
jgi:endonuclease/exonuclease/phosphatase family metal-dependent hydrolase